MQHSHQFKKMSAYTESLQEQNLLKTITARREKSFMKINGNMMKVVVVVHEL